MSWSIDFLIWKKILLIFCSIWFYPDCKITCLLTGLKTKKMGYKLTQNWFIC